MDDIKFTPFKTMGNRYYIIHNSEVKGIIEFKDKDDCFRIEYIKIYNEYRRMGIGTKVVNFIKEKNHNKCICGDSLPEAIGFWTSIGVEFEEEISNDTTTPFHIK